MNQVLIRLLLFGWLLTICSADPLSYNQHIRPIFSDRCFKCHGPDAGTQEAGLRLDTAEGATAALEGDPQRFAIVPGDLSRSEVIRRITAHDPDDIMPPDKSELTLSAAEIALIKRWVAEGATYEAHWAFMPLNSGKPDQQIDDYLAARHDGLSFAPPADKRTLLKRVSFDLTGLPPSSEEIERFLADEAPDAYARLVDRLLASPAYGEHMAIRWIDAARYADTSGYQADWERFMWPWRDWVIQAYNHNMPYDQFTIEQLAGDLLPNPTLDQRIATGFNRNHRINDEGGVIAAEYAVEYVVDRVETTSAIWLGLTMGCARCHDHKYDPISQQDFYAFFSFFNNVPEKGKDGRAGYATPTIDVPQADMLPRLRALETELAERNKALGDADAVLKETIDQLRAQLDSETPSDAKLPKDIVAALGAEKATPKQKKRLEAYVREQHAGLKARASLAKEVEAARKKAFVKVMVMQEMETPRETFVLQRGQYDQPDKERPVSAAIPAVFGALPEGLSTNRLGLAKWLVQPDHPLTARVEVNRYWQMLFGRGLVKTAEDFGAQGALPSHPRLLDHLAQRFIASGWDTQAMLKYLVTSRTYQQSSKVTPELLERDPENILLARGPRFRLSAYQLRDQALALSGLLVDRIGGPSVKPYQPPGLWAEVSFQDKKRSTDFFVQDHGEKLYRRSLYTFWKRSVAPPQMATFDAAGREACSVGLVRTSTPLQALTLMNDVTFVEAARAFATRMLTKPRAPVHYGLKLASIEATPELIALLSKSREDYRKIFAANPEAAEAFVRNGESAVPTGVDFPELATYTALASVMLNLDQVVTKE
ncbi:MAG: hypothetical protein ACI9QL_002141 [Candidatus Omnitrophota bacterium]|jgi:hypothetical protein